MDKLKERVRGIIQREGGKVLKVTNWGKKKVAFPVAKQTRGIYLHFHYLAGPGMVAEVERNLRNTEEVTKFISTKLAVDVDPDTRQVEQDVKLAGDVDEAVRPPRPEGEERGHGEDDEGDFGGREFPAR